MQRINSVNARPDVNGKDKVGFHDNTDLQGQDATYLTPAWCNQVQEELANAIEAFTALNGEKDQLAKILLNLSKQVTDIGNRVIEDLKVGDLFLTMIDFADNDAVFKHKGYGEWQRVGNGHALLTKAVDNSRPEWMRTIGNTGGSDTHTLSIDQMPRHHHETLGFMDGYGTDDRFRKVRNGGAFASDETPDQIGYWTSEDTGNNQPHNNIQLSYVIGVWRRVN